jgi:hypothetical protein
LFDLAVQAMKGPQKRKLQSAMKGCLAALNRNMHWYYGNFKQVDMSGLHDYLRLENTAIPNIYDKTLRKFITYEPFWREFTLRLVRAIIFDSRMIVEILRGKIETSFKPLFVKFNFSNPNIRLKFFFVFSNFD